MEYFNRIAASFTITEREKKVVSRSSNQWGDQGSAHWNRVEQADNEDVQAAPVFADSKEHTSAKSSQCQYTTKQKQRAVLYAGVQKYYSALIHVLGALLIEAPLGHYIFLAVLIRSAFQRWNYFLWGAYIRNYQ